MKESSRKAIEAMRKSRLLSLEEVNRRIQIIHGGLYHLVSETYEGTKKKSWFFDTELKEWFCTKVEYILAGHGNPSRRADKIRIKQTPHLQRLAKERTKYIGSDGVILTDLCKKYDIASAAYLKLASSISTDFAINALQSHIKDGQYIKYQSNLELYFIELFKDIFPNLTKWNKNPVEVNIQHRPDFRLEYNGKVVYVDLHGLFFHSEYKVSKEYHKSRALDFRNNNLTYIQIFGDELIEKGIIVKSLILSKLGFLSNKKYARKLQLLPVDFEIAKKFLEENHLMGYKFSTSIGLWDGNELISLLSYKNKKGHIELERFCTKINTQCVGGFGKLVEYLKQFNKPIISYCDLRYADGHSYEAIGFKNIGETLGWSWTEGAHRYNRLMCKAGNGKTERENASIKKWFKIYDAGQRKYLLTI
jgi:hypothetical protein